MNTIEYYLRRLDYYRTLFIANLRKLGISCDDDEKFNTLIPKIYKLATSGEVIVDNFSLRNFQGTAEEIDYIMEHTIVTGTSSTSMSGRFYNVPNLTYLDLRKFPHSTSSTGKMTDCNKLHGSGTVDFSTGVNLPTQVSPLVTLICKGLILGSGSSGDSYENLEYLDLEDATIDKNTLASYTSGSKKPELQVNLKNMKYSDSSLSGVFNKDNINLIDFDSVTFTRPLIDLGGLTDLKLLEEIDLSNLNLSKTSNITWGVFLKNCSNLKTLEGIDVLEGTKYGAITWSGLNSLEGELIMPSITTSSFNITDMDKLSKLDVSKVIDTTALTTTRSMTNKFRNIGFDSGVELTENNLILPENYFTDFIISSFNSTFRKNGLLKNVVIDGFYTAFTTNYGTIQGLCEECPNLETFYMRSKGVKAGYTTAYDLWGSHLRYCPNLKSVYIELHCPGATSKYRPGSSDAFMECPKLETVTIKIHTGTIDMTEAFTNRDGKWSDNSLESLKELKIIDSTISALPFTSSKFGEARCGIIKSLNKITFENCTVTATKVAGFLTNSLCTDLDISTIDFSKVKEVYYFLKDMANLQNFKMCKNFGKGFPAKHSSSGNVYGNDDRSISLAKSTLLTHESLLDIINNIYDLNIVCGVYDEEGNPGTGTLLAGRILLSSESVEKLTPEEIAIATNKGWTILSSS